MDWIVGAGVEWLRAFVVGFEAVTIARLIIIDWCHISKVRTIKPFDSTIVVSLLGTFSILFALEGTGDETRCLVFVLLTCTLRDLATA